MVTKFSRRSAEVEEAEKEAVQSDQGARSRRTGHVCRWWRATSWGRPPVERKRDDLTLADYRDYWNSRITPEEARQIADDDRAGRGRG